MLHAHTYKAISEDQSICQNRVPEYISIKALRRTPSTLEGGGQPSVFFYSPQTSPSSTPKNSSFLQLGMKTENVISNTPLIKFIISRVSFTSKFKMSLLTSPPWKTFQLVAISLLFLGEQIFVTSNVPSMLLFIIVAKTLIFIISLQRKKRRGICK